MSFQMHPVPTGQDLLAQNLTAAVLALAMASLRASASVSPFPITVSGKSETNSMTPCGLVTGRMSLTSECAPLHRVDIVSSLRTKEGSIAVVARMSETNRRALVHSGADLTFATHPAAGS